MDLELTAAQRRLQAIVARADECLSHLEDRERLGRRVKAAQRRRAAQASPLHTWGARGKAAA